VIWAWQQQLVEIAKALNKQVRLLILDEPTASLTEQETAVLLDIIRDLQNHGIACVYISHKQRSESHFRHHLRYPRWSTYWHPRCQQHDRR
jgi:ABC-type uncharacterized transport system ATPase subunit